MPIGAVIATVVVYTAVVVLLLSLQFTSPWRWWIKAAAISTAGAFFVGSYTSIVAMLGWSTDQDMPQRFALIATRVVEPDDISGFEGAIYFWVEELDEYNIPSGRPRAYQVAYSPEVAEAAQMGQEMLNEGEAVEGVMPEGDAIAEVMEGTPASESQTAAGQASGSSLEMDSTIRFNGMPGVLLPAKGVS